MFTMVMIASYVEDLIQQYHPVHRKGKVLGIKLVDKNKYLERLPCLVYVRKTGSGMLKVVLKIGDMQQEFRVGDAAKFIEKIILDIENQHACFVPIHEIFVSSQAKIYFEKQRPTCQTYRLCNNVKELRNLRRQQFWLT